jgi:prophage regulatory protein
VHVDADKLMGHAEIRQRLGVGETRVRQITGRPDFPPPVKRLIMGQVWDGDQVEAWIAAHRPPPDEPEG